MSMVGMSICCILGSLLVIRKILLDVIEGIERAEEKYGRLVMKEE